MSDIEENLDFQLRAVGLNPKRQYKFHPERRYKVDFAFPEHRLIVEVNGGVWMPKSGHNSGVGITRDYQKSNVAQLMGYTYLQFTRKDIEDGTALATIEEVIRRSNQ